MLSAQLLAKKVSIFWDIENCRPKMNSILEVVANIRNLVLQGRQVIFVQKCICSGNTQITGAVLHGGLRRHIGEQGGDQAVGGRPRVRPAPEQNEEGLVGRGAEAADAEGGGHKCTAGQDRSHLRSEFTYFSHFRHIGG